MNEKVYTNKYTNKMKNAPLFWLFLLSIGWPCAMVWGGWLSDGWAAVLIVLCDVRKSHFTFGRVGCQWLGCQSVSTVNACF